MGNTNLAWQKNTKIVQSYICKSAAGGLQLALCERNPVGLIPWPFPCSLAIDFVSSVELEKKGINRNRKSNQNSAIIEPFQEHPLKEKYMFLNDKNKIVAYIQLKH